MSISRRVRDELGRASWIRRMTEEGRARRGLTPWGEPLADLALGNPVVEPPPEFREALAACAADPTPGQHRYIPNVGRNDAREWVAERITRASGISTGMEQVVMSVGAAGGIAIALRAILDPGDEVIYTVPFFVEYEFYATSHGGVPVTVETRPDFHLDLEAIARAITPRTRALILNSPNNPSGVVYRPAELAGLAAILATAAVEHGRTIHLISDEPYRDLLLAPVEVPWPARFYPHTFTASSFSKSLGIPGERIGYVIAHHPVDAGRGELIAAMSFAMRALGFVNAPVLMQRVIARMPVDIKLDCAGYKDNARRLAEGLAGIGLNVELPEGALFLFPSTGERDDVELAFEFLEAGVIVVPGRGFGRERHLRISYAVSPQAIDLALAAFERASKTARSLGA